MRRGQVRGVADEHPGIQRVDGVMQYRHVGLVVGGVAGRLRGLVDLQFLFLRAQNLMLAGIQRDEAEAAAFVVGTVPEKAWQVFDGYLAVLRDRGVGRLFIGRLQVQRAGAGVLVCLFGDGRDADVPGRGRHGAVRGADDAGQS